MDLSTIEAHVLKHRPQLKPNSARTYALSLKTIAPEGAQDFSWITDTDYSLQRIEKFKDTTRKNVLNALIVISDKQSDAFKVYTEHRDKYNQLYTEHNKAHKKTEGQEKNWVEWPQYLELVKKLKAEVSDLRGGALSKREFQKMQDYIVVLLYSHYPLRNDFADVKVISQREYRKVTPAMKTEQNYLVKRGNNYALILNEYKTSKKYGEKIIEISPVVAAALRRWLTFNKSGYLLVDTVNPSQPMTSNGTSKTFARIGLKHLGKRLGSSLLRHSYLSHKYADVAEQKEKDAALMMHSVAMADDYIKT